MDKSLKDFALNRKSFEEQSATIEELQAQLKQMEQNLAEHVEYIEVNGLHCFLFQNDLLLRNQFFVLIIKQIPKPRTSYDNDEKNEKY
jgi:hypothetical protein